MPKKQKYPRGRKTNICIDCKNACGGCSWADKFIPVPDWKATPATLDMSGKKKRTCHTWHITECPEFEEG